MNIKDMKGQVIIYIALVIVVLILIVGVAIDGGIGMAVDAKVAAAVDAAAIAAGNAIKKGGDIPTRKANAEAAALKFYYANLGYDPNNPGDPGYLRSIPSPPIINITQVLDPDDGSWHGEWLIEVTGEAVVPTFFLRIAGNKTFTAAAETLSRDVDMSLVLDVSSSLVGVFDHVQDGALQFIDKFSSDADRIALVSFATGVVVNEQIRQVAKGFDEPNITGDVSGLSLPGSSGGYNSRTNFGEGLWHGKNQLDSVNTANRSSLRIMVFFTDGSPNTISSDFPGGYLGSVITCKNPGDCNPVGYFWLNQHHNDRPQCCYNLTGNTAPQYYNAHGTDEYQLWPSRRGVTSGYISSVRINSMARNLAEDIAEHARSEGIIVYTLGLEGSGNHMTGPSGAYGERGQDILKRMANTPDSDTYDDTQPSGLFVLAMSQDELNDAFKEIAAHILRLTK